MTPAEIDKSLGGSTTFNNATSQNTNSAQPTTQNSIQKSSPTLSPAQIDQNLGGSISLNGTQAQDDGKNFLQQVGDFFTGNTQKFGQTTGQALAAPGNADLYTEAVKSYTDVNSNLLKAIATKKASGQDTTHLQTALQQHIADAPKLQDFTGDVINKTPEQIAGEAGGTALEALSGGTLGVFDAPEEASALSKIGRATTIGAGYGAAGGATNAMQNNASVGDVGTQALTNAAIGGATGGTISGIGQGVESILKNLPTRLVQNAIPGLDKEGAQYALDTKPIGTIDKLFGDSTQAVKSLNGQIDSILQHPDLADEKVNTGQLFNQILYGNFPNSNYTDQTLVNVMKSLAPEKAKLIDKLEAGDASLYEANEIKKALYSQTKKVFTDTPVLNAKKQLGATIATSIANTIKTQATETAPIFEKMSKEINLRNLLRKVYKKEDSKKILGLYDLANLGLGNSVGGLPGAFATEAGAKLAKNPAVKFGLAKTLNSIAETPGLKTAVNKLNTKL